MSFISRIPPLLAGGLALGLRLARYGALGYGMHELTGNAMDLVDPERPDPSIWDVLGNASMTASGFGGPRMGPIGDLSIMPFTAGKALFGNENEAAEAESMLPYTLIGPALQAAMAKKASPGTSLIRSFPQPYTAPNLKLAGSAAIAAPIWTGVEAARNAERNSPTPTPVPSPTAGPIRAPAPVAGTPSPSPASPKGETLITIPLIDQNTGQYNNVMWEPNETLSKIRTGEFSSMSKENKQTLMVRLSSYFRNPDLTAELVRWAASSSNPPPQLPSPDAPPIVPPSPSSSPYWSPYLEELLSAPPSPSAPYSMPAPSSPYDPFDIRGSDDNVYEVGEGDNLWTIAAKLQGLGNEDPNIIPYWQELINSNQDILRQNIEKQGKSGGFKYPDLIYAGQKLRTPKKKKKE